MIKEKITQSDCENAKPREKPYKLYVSVGLYLFIKPSGSKLWRLKYRFNNTERVYSIGKFDLIPLDQALMRAQEVRRMVANNIDPATVKKKGQNVTLRQPLKILRDELKHMEGMRERLDYKKKEIENQLDDVMFDLNEICTFIEELRLSIKHLEHAIG